MGQTPVVPDLFENTIGVSFLEQDDEAFFVGVVVFFTDQPSDEILDGGEGGVIAVELVKVTVGLEKVIMDVSFS